MFCLSDAELAGRELTTSSSSLTFQGDVSIFKKATTSTQNYSKFSQKARRALSSLGSSTSYSPTFSAAGKRSLQFLLSNVIRGFVAFPRYAAGANAI